MSGIHTYVCTFASMGDMGYVVDNNVIGSELPGYIIDKSLLG